jgi:enamine deaminase RidA (YjgF/YER057c/UK114 family)
MVEQIIMRSGSSTLNGFNFDHIVPASGTDFKEQARSCVEQLQNFIHREQGIHLFITQQTFFIKARTREEYESRAAIIREQLQTYCGTNLPATSIVAQSPSCNMDVVLELICAKAVEGKKVTYKSLSGVQYTVIDYHGYKTVHCAGLMGHVGDTITQASERAFELASAILKLEGLSIRNIIRQWNYIEKIAYVDEAQDTPQNYQDFNDVRARYYDQVRFDHGYPAATGIGQDTGGVIISLIALSDSPMITLKPIANPGQIDAHRYSEMVLKGNSAQKCTPKFERAKLVTIGSRNYIYVSGTASILGEKTVHEGDVEKQTLTTIENIKRLFSKENQKKLGLDFEMEEIQFSHLRVYVKYKEDIPAVEKVCEAELNSKSSLYLVSDVCRENLLVEIEGVFNL